MLPIPRSAAPARSIVVLLLSALLAPSATGQQLGGAQVIGPETSALRSAFVADLDGDSDPDLLTASSTSGKIAWHANLDGLGTFGPQRVVSNSVPDAQCVLAEDLDLDGDRDVLFTAVGWHGKVGWFRNEDGLGSFGAEQTIEALEQSAYSAVAADLDGDGDPDVVTASGSPENVITRYDNTDGLGGFAPGVVAASVAGGIIELHAADLDADGDLDFLSASTSFSDDDEILWFENTDGLGSLGAPQTLQSGSDGGYSVSVVDLDGDMDLDVVSAARFDHEVSWYENTDGLGAFGPAQLIEGGGLGGTSGRSIATADLDQDGDVDVLSTGRFVSEIVWFENTNGAGSFGPVQSVPVAVKDAEVLLAADLDGDLDADFVVGASFKSKLAWFENTDASGTFGPEQIVSGYADDARFATPVDVDGDGDRDVLAAFYGSDTVAWFENTDGAGLFGGLRALTHAAAGAVSVAGADLDGDGDADALWAASPEGMFPWEVFDSEVAWQPNGDGAGTFGPSQPLVTTVRGAHTVLAEDLDGDGDLDAFVASAVDGITWHENTDGLGNFGPEQVLDSASSEAVFVADLDGDADLDVVSGSGSLRWLENLDGAGNFGSAQSISFPDDEVGAVEAVDVDGDGDRDLFTGTWYTTDLPQGEWETGFRFAWHENLDGQGTFGSQQALPNLHDPDYFGEYGELMFTTTDLDGDGDADVVTSSQFGSGLAWHENEDGLGTFGPERSLEFNWRFSLRAADLDGDGYEDLVTAGAGNNVSWHRNQQAPLTTDLSGIGAGFGGTQELYLDAGAQHALQPYLILGTASGTSPGLLLGALVLPLQVDWYFTLTLTHPNSPPLTGSFGVLDASGSATASFTLPSGINLPFPGLTLHHAFVVLDLTSAPGLVLVDFVSNAVGLEVLP